MKKVETDLKRGVFPRNSFKSRRLAAVTVAFTLFAAMFAGCASSKPSQSTALPATPQATAKSEDAELLAKTVNGKFLGKKEASGIISYKGIPFGKAKRWQPAVDPDPSEETKKAYEYGPAAIQAQKDKFPNQSEDCLTLNIWTSGPDAKGKPVMVWIYGGSYVQGSASDARFDGEALVKENPGVVVVGVNYRVGVLGTLNLSTLDPEGKYKYSNNLCLLDVQQSLRWINKNIKAFGGDPANVTLFGQSAGSNNITSQLLIEESRKYFHKIIGQSSFAVDLGLVAYEDSITVSNKFIEATGCKTLKELEALTPDQILAAQDVVMKTNFKGIYTKLFSPVKDGVTIPKDPYGELLKGSAKNIKAILGSNMGEYDQMYVGKSDAQAREFTISRNLDKLTNQDALIDKYVANDSKRPAFDAYKDIQNDLYQRMPSILLAEALGKHNDVYMYYFTWQDPKSNIRSAHGSEIPLVFNHAEAHVPADMAANMRKAWVSFAKTGNPNHSGIPTWPTYNAKTRETMVFDAKTTVEKDVRGKDREVLAPLFAETARLR